MLSILFLLLPILHSSYTQGVQPFTAGVKGCVYGFTGRNVDDVSLQECKRLCLAESNFVCNALEYIQKNHEGKQFCSLSKETRESQPGAWEEPCQGDWADMVYMERIGAFRSNNIYGYESLGCWKDTGNRAIATLEGSDNRLRGNYWERKHAVEICFQVAKSKGFPAFAVQEGGWCAASKTVLETYKKYGPATNCSHGKGGGWANDVYKIEDCVEVIEEDRDYEGSDLFEVTEDGEFVPNSNNKKSDSPEDCRDICRATDRCQAWTYVHLWGVPCLLKKSDKGKREMRLARVSGNVCKYPPVIFLGPGSGYNGYSAYLSLPDLGFHHNSIKPYPINRINGAVAAFIDEKVMVCGGATPAPVVLCYTLTDWTSEYTPKYRSPSAPDKTDWKEWSPGPSMAKKRSYAAGTKTEDGWWVTGGTNDTSTEILVNGAWVPGPELPTAMFGHCLLKLNSEKYFITGGVTDTLNLEARFDDDISTVSNPSYLVQNGVYSKVEGGPSVLIPACAMLGEDAYVVGGINTLTKDGSSEVHVWSKGQWKEGPELPVPIWGSSLVSYENQLYLLGGVTGNLSDGAFPFVELIYKLDQGAWTAVELYEDVNTYGRTKFPALVVPQK